MKIAIGSDHGGFELKAYLKSMLVEKGYQVTDFGPDTSDSVDYPVYAKKVAAAVVAGEAERGILLCGTGIGMSIAANKINGIRASLVHDSFSAHATREHNDANILCLGARVIGVELAKELTNIWLQTEFQGGRHAKRVAQMMELEG
ncbi:MAG: ribose 5-phosphate isomerase B [Clostridia bacterium]